MNFFGTTAASRQRSSRFFVVPIAIAFVVAVCLIAAQAASANVELTPYGGSTELTPGSHGDLTVGANFSYTDAGGLPSLSEDVRSVVVDTPAGGVGNPNAVPYDQRCTKTQFETSTCPPESQIGVVKLSAIVEVLSLPIDLTGTISIIQNEPGTDEVPTVVGAYIEPPIGDPVRSYATFYPVTSGPDGDFRLRSVTSDFPRQAAGLDIRITKYEQLLWGRLSGGRVFITAPTRCDTWNSYGYARAYDSNSNADADPLVTGTNEFRKSVEVPTTPDCSTLAPFGTTAVASMSSGKRFSSPDFSTTVEIPGLEAEPQSAAIPKSIVATLPKGLNVDVQQLGRICTAEQFSARACPASTKVGTVDITTPQIVKGLQGEAYLTTTSPGGTLPDLGLIIHGAINFSLRGVNHYVNVSQLQSTFDNVPQVGFSKFKLDIAGGPNGLLKTRQCPGGSKTPTDTGPVHFEITSYQGQQLTSDSPMRFDGCYKVTIKKIKKCVKSKLKLSATYESRSLVKNVKLSVRGMKSKTIKKSPFKVNVKLGKKVKKGKKLKYKLKVTYKPNPSDPKGKTVTKTGTFKRCR